MAPYERVEGFTYPQIYQHFKGKLNNGKCRNYWIQDLTDEYKSEVIQKYISGFLVDEPTCACAGVKNDALCVKEMSEICMDILNLNISLICLTNDDDGVTTIAGFNTLYVLSKGADKLKMKSEAAKKVIAVMSYFETRKDPFIEFDSNEYLSGYGLYVLPEFRKEGVARELLYARDKLCKSVGFKLTITFFSNPGSYIPAERAGFNEFVTLAYDDMAKIDESIHLHGIEKYSLIGKLMYKHYV